MTRPANALPKNLTNKLAYCDQCKPVVAIGWGGFMDDKPPIHCTPGGNPHDAKLIEIDASERVAPGEPQDKFLDRMKAKYLK